MTLRLFILILTQMLIVLLGANALAYTGESEPGDTIRALMIMTGRSPSETVTVEEDIDGDGRIGLAEAIYWMQDAAGIPFVDSEAQDYEMDFLLSALDFEITVGERQEIVILDTPRVGNDDQAYNREDLIFTTISGEEVAQVETENLTDSEEDTYYYIRGLSQGVAVFQISYDGYTGQKPLVAVNVKAADAAGPMIETDIVLTKYDIVYFTEESVDFTFTVTTDEEATITAEVNGTVYVPQDDSFTVPLFNGYNPIVITAVGATGTTTKVINLRAKKCAFSVVNMSRTRSEFFYEGDIVTLDFTGLVQPVPKVSHIYNPSANRVTYDTDMPRYSVITGTTAQYSVNNVEMELTAAGTYSLTNGHINVNWFGSALYSEASVGASNPVLDAPQTDNSFSVLPDIHITVLENPEYAPVLFTSAVGNTEEIWPGDKVVITIEDLDIDAIAEAHPDDDDSWYPYSIIDSYTVFVSDLPGLETITSGHAEAIGEIENLKTISFTVSEETPPGTYQVRGGYVWVKYGPSWWTQETYYYKGMIPDITIVVVEAVPGQVHGALSIESDALKSRLAVALGLGEDYTGELTTAELKTLTGALDLSASGITDADMALMQYLTGVTAIDLSGNPDITSETVKKATFDWTLEKTLDFSGCTGLTELTDAAFYNATHLVGIVLPDTLTHLGAECFSGCTSLAAITLPAALETIGDRCFYGCQALTRITIPEGVTSLGARIFQSCTGLQAVVLPDTLQGIGDYCFYYCPSLSDISLPASLTAIGQYAFGVCRALPFIDVPDGLTTVGSYAFNSTGILLADLRGTAYTAGQAAAWGLTNTGIVFLTGTDAGVDPASATLNLGEETLTLTHQIPNSETITWGSTDTQVAMVSAGGVVSGVTAGTAYIYVQTAEGAYDGYCKVIVAATDTPGLAALALSDDVLNETFDPQRFYYTVNLGCYSTEIRITATLADSASTLSVNGVTTADNTPSEPAALAMGENTVTVTVTTGEITKTYDLHITMEEIYAGDTALSITNAAFAGQLALAAGKGEGYLGPLTYAELAAIEGELDLSGLGLTDTDMAAMQYLTGVSAIDLSGNTALTAAAADGSLFDWTTLTRLDFSGCTGITEIPESAFYGCSTLTEIVLPETVTALGGHSFYRCYALTTVNFPAALATIGQYAFSDATSLTSVVLPAAITGIGQYAFQNCTALTAADLSRVSPDALAESYGLFMSCTAITNMSDIQLPTGLTALPEAFFRNCTGITAIMLPDSVTALGQAVFQGCTGIEAVDLTNMTELGVGLFSGCTHLAQVTLPTNIAALPQLCFAYCTSLISVDLPATLTTLEGRVFMGCTALAEIILPNNLTTLGSSIFENCTALTAMAFPEGLIEIGSSAFSSCTSLTVVSLPDSVTTLGTGVFSGCTSLAALRLPSTITELPASSLRGCTALTEVTLPDTLTTIGDYCFRETGITHITIPNNVTEMGNYVFRGCANLVSVQLPNTLTTLPQGVFFQCTALMAVDLPDTITVMELRCFRDSGITYLKVPAGVTDIGSSAFDGCTALAILDLSATAYTAVDSSWSVPDTTTVLLPGQDAGLSATELSLAVEQSATLTHAIPEDTSVTWISSNTAVATVTAEGLVTGAYAGTALIAVKADDNSYNGTCRVTVTTE